MSTGGGTATSSAQFNPPASTAAPWQSYIDQGYTLSQQPYQQYNGQLVADPTAATNAAQSQIQGMATGGTDVTQSSRGVADDVANGRYLNSSPWTDPSYVNNVIAQNAQTMAGAAAIGQNAQTDSMAALHGGYGGSAWAGQQAQNSAALNNSIGQMANNYQLGNAQMGNSNYMTGINQMLQGGQLGQQVNSGDLATNSALNASGQQQQTQQQNILNSLYGQYQQQLNWPYQQQQQLGNTLANASGNYGTNTQLSNPYGTNNSGAGLLGLGALGVGAYQSGLLGGGLL